MKKIVLALVLGLTSCGGSKNEPMVVEHLDLRELCSREVCAKKDTSQCHPESITFEVWEAYCLPKPKKRLIEWETTREEKK